jgi:hypothetical protein
VHGVNSLKVLTDAHAYLQFVVRISLAPAGRAVVGHCITKLDGGARGLVTVVVDPEAAAVAARHVAVRGEPHLHSTSKGSI